MRTSKGRATRLNARGEVFLGFFEPPTGGAVASFHEAKHRVFQRMYEDQVAYRSMMGIGATPHR